MLTITGPRVAAGFAVAVMAAGCSAGGAGGGAAAPPAKASTSVSGAPVSPAAGTGCDNSHWHSVPVTVTHKVSVPPVPVIKDVRVAQHPECGYDRVVLDVAGQVPGYSVRYVDTVVGDASGQTIAIPGTRYLLVTFRPAQAHSDAGAPTLPSAIQQPRYPALASWVLAGDFEGAVKIAFGLAGQASVRTGELPGRVYIDIRE